MYRISLRLPWVASVLIKIRRRNFAEREWDRARYHATVLAGRGRRLRRRETGKTESATRVATFLSMREIVGEVSNIVRVRWTRRKSLCILTAALMVAGCVVWSASRRNVSNEVSPAPQAGVTAVVLIHGLGRTSASMAPLATRLEGVGFDVHNWDYPSTQETIETHSDRLRQFLSNLDADPNVERIHVVTHSLGGIVIRHALTVERPTKMGRVVMLAPPNKGSASATFWAPIAGKIIKPLTELSDDPESSVNQLGVPIGIDIGVIAASSDGKVAIADTHLPGETDHLVVPGFHTFIMARDDVFEQVVRFLAIGRFDHSKATSND